ncbi:unnamed protein product [Rotaria magnacalcarata]
MEKQHCSTGIFKQLSQTSTKNTISVFKFINYILSTTTKKEIYSLNYSIRYQGNRFIFVASPTSPSSS